jgi:hypothetical protein
MPKHQKVHLQSMAQRHQNLVSLASSKRGGNAVPRGLGMLVPDASIVKLPFVHREGLFSHNTNAWMIGNTLNVRINNAYDPIQGTHQPYGWDQCAALYRRYKVLGFKLTVMALNMNATKPVHLVMRPVPVNENKSIQDTYLENCLEWPSIHDFPVASAGGPISKKTIVVDIPKLLGITQDQYIADTSRYSADVTSAPQYGYVQVGVAGSDSAAYADVTIRIEYVVQFWQRVTQDQS